MKVNWFDIKRMAIRNQAKNNIFSGLTKQQKIDLLEQLAIDFTLKNLNSGNGTALNLFNLIMKANKDNYKSSEIEESLHKKIVEIMENQE